MTTSTPLAHLDNPSADAQLTLLLADDDKDSREYLKMLISLEGHRVIEAENGQQAIDLFRQHNPDIVLMDIIMPILDGYAATKAIKSFDEQNHVPVLFITSLTDNDSLLKCIEAGGDDFLTKPYNAILLYAKLNAHARIRSLTQGLKKRNELLDYFRVNTEREHRIAERVFNKRLALGQMKTPQVNYHVSSMAIFNGDIFQCVIRQEYLYLLLGDFTGHGLAAATGTLPVADAFQSLTQDQQPISAIATHLNALLKEILPGDMFCAATLLRLHLPSLQLESWTGGLPALQWFHHQRKDITTIASMHMPFGILNAKDFDNNTEHFTLEEGDKLYLYTDGLTEAMNRDNEMFGEERLQQALVNEGASLNAIERVLKAVAVHTGNHQQQDDVSIIELLATPDRE